MRTFREREKRLAQLEGQAHRTQTFAHVVASWAPDDLLLHAAWLADEHLIYFIGGQWIQHVATYHPGPEYGPRKVAQVQQGIPEITDIADLDVICTRLNTLAITPADIQTLLDAMLATLEWHEIAEEMIAICRIHHGHIAGPRTFKLGVSSFWNNAIATVANATWPEGRIIMTATADELSTTCAGLEAGTVVISRSNQSHSYSALFGPPYNTTEAADQALQAWCRQNDAPFPATAAELVTLIRAILAMEGACYVPEDL